MYKDNSFFFNNYKTIIYLLIVKNLLKNSLLDNKNTVTLTKIYYHSLLILTIQFKIFLFNVNSIITNLFYLPKDFGT